MDDRRRMTGMRSQYWDDIIEGIGMTRKGLLEFGSSMFVQL
ncbi:hypothetical protein [Wolbachia endosymbiont of Atemnus politus]|nr:hypothetical protein [Wolbachia endosymbiont of Atemnus politus]